MAINILFSAQENRWEEYKDVLETAFSDNGLDAKLRIDFPPEEVDYIVYAPNGGLLDFAPYTRCKAVLGLWAGVETIQGNETLTMPLARMVDHGLTQGMVEWVVGHVLRHHLNTDLHVKGQDGLWRDAVPPLATDRQVGVLGIGALGAACATALAGLGFDVTGWSRSPKDIPDVRCLSGQDGLDETLKGSEILVLLLPLTSETECVLDSRALALMPPGAVIINPGRGPLIDDDALLAALNSGHINHATLDVFRIEPLPQDHPFWAHPKVTVTPHIASETRASSAAQVIADNIRRSETGEPLLHLVDRGLGY